MPKIKNKDVVKAKGELLAERKPKKKLSLTGGLSTGSTLLNLACTGTPNAGFLRGGYYLIVGDSASGKTFLSLTCLAEAAKQPSWNNYEFIYDNVEGGAQMDWPFFFGEKAARRIRPPHRDKEGNDIYSETIEDLYFNIDDATKTGKPFVYVVDSMDALTSEEEEEKFAERKKAKEKGGETTGSYGTSKAKANSSGIRQILRKVRKSGSILIIISQTRDNIGFGATYNKKTRSGGRALRFYADLELWSSIKGTLDTTVKGKKFQTGITCEIVVKKNRINGKLNKVEFPIFHSVGISDVDGCVDYLLEWKHWKKDKQTIDASDIGFSGTYEKLIDYIQNNDKEQVVKETVGKLWQEIEEEAAVKRKPRYQ